MNEANASGILPFESSSSFGSIRQTEIEYQSVRKPAMNAHADANLNQAKNKEQSQ